MRSVVAFLNDCRLGKKQVSRNLTVFPVLFPRVIEPCYLTLEQAMESGRLLITEVNASGDVNHLKLRNNSDQPVLLVEGEALKGAKQNRVVNASFLIAGETVTKIPVSCVEERRWHYDTRKFTSGEKVMHASLRRESQACLQENLWRGDGHRSDQGRIWSHIAEKSKRMNVHSDTMAMSDVFNHFEDTLNEFSGGFHLIEQQVGALFAMDGAVAGLECFDSSGTFSRFFKKLINSYLMAAIESADPPPRHTSVHLPLVAELAFS